MVRSLKIMNLMNWSRTWISLAYGYITSCNDLDYVSLERLIV
jgi:hypothetical protein